MGTIFLVYDLLDVENVSGARSGKSINLMRSPTANV